MKLKIGILGTRGIPNAYGGFEQFAQHLSYGLSQKGHEVFVYSSSLHFYQQKQWQGVNIIHCKDWEDKIGTAGQFVYDWNCITDSRKRGFDILLHLGYTSDSAWHWRWPKKPVNIVNMDGLEWKRSKYSKPAQWFLKRAEAWAAEYADHLIADSTAIREYLLSSYHKHSTYIPYGAEIFNDPDPSVLLEFNLQPQQYYLTVSRMEPENNVEMIINGYLNSAQTVPLIIVGGVMNKSGKSWAKKYTSEKIKFLGGIYDKTILNNLRFFSKLHFHGHSAGGTNPSLLEAMACGCRIAAHENIFNRAILQNEADYFSNAGGIAAIINHLNDDVLIRQRKQANIEKIKSVYNWDKIINTYEDLMLELSSNRK
jgi:glycosyltransferase involved in cell wall biosynthesis